MDGLRENKWGYIFSKYLWIIYKSFVLVPKEINAQIETVCWFLLWAPRAGCGYSGTCPLGGDNPRFTDSCPTLTLALCETSRKYIWDSPGVLLCVLIHSPFFCWVGCRPSPHRVCCLRWTKNMNEGGKSVITSIWYHYLRNLRESTEKLLPNNKECS